jgi:outer membrane PBP1 activator LpoA protein
MLLKSGKLLLICLAASLASACSTPCDAPGKLCAPVSSITSAPRVTPQSAAQAAPPPRKREAPPPEAETFAVMMPGTQTEMPAALPVSAAVPSAARAADGRPAYRIGLMLPLRSDSLGAPAEALRAGFMAAWERDRDGIAVTLIDTGDAPQEVLPAYTAALAQQDMIVGPLARSAVTALASSALVSKPTIALNYPEGRGETLLPPQMLVMGLSIEDEARQTADWAAREQPGAIAYILAGSAAWQRRSASAFAGQWERLSRSAKTADMTMLNGYLSDGELVQLRTRLQAEPSALLFVALEPDQARQLRVALSSPPLRGIPIYGTSSLNPGKAKLLPGPELDGVRLLDLPWQLQRDHPAVMVYPQPTGVERNADLERLYALGIDAFRVAREIARKQPSNFKLDGVTGQLEVRFGEGAASFERRELPAVYKDGVPLPLSSATPP